jgi:hypothetical protein
LGIGFLEKKPVNQSRFSSNLNSSSHGLAPTQFIIHHYYLTIYMKKTFILLLLITPLAFSQEKKTIWSKFVNITEIGIMTGRVKYNTDTWNTNPVLTQVNRRVSPTLQMFNGFQIKPKTAVGITVSADIYGNTMLMPIAVGVRQTLIEKPNKKTQLMGSFDAGYGTTLINLDNTTNVTKGGLMLNPMMGYRIPNKGGSAWLLNFGYKTQFATVNKNAGFDDFASQEKRTYNRFVFRMGFQF